MPDRPGHKEGAGDRLDFGEGLGEGFGIEDLDPLAQALLLGQRFQSVRADDGSLFAFDRVKGERVSGELAPAAPPDPLKGIQFLTDPNTETFFAFNPNATNPLDVLTVISEQTPEIQQGFQHILEAALAIDDAGLNPLKYDFVFEDGKVVPKIAEQIPPTQDSFSTATDASGQLLVISRLTGASAPIGATPKAADVPPDGKVELDSVTGQFKVTQPSGQISFLQAPVDIQLPQELTIGGQPFAFNPNTGGFQQIQQPTERFDAGVVTEGGRAFIQQPDGSLTPLGREEVPNLDELINERIISGDSQGALALADFRDRPTSLEAFNAAMQFARSPGDVAAISAISRGQSLVSPPPSGTVQRIAEQPKFLQDAFSRLINQFRGGSGSPGEFMDVLTRINKEFTEEKAAREAQEQKTAALEEKNRRLEFSAQMEAALAPFRTEISNLKLAVSNAKAGTVSGTTVAQPQPQPPPDEFVPAVPRGADVTQFGRGGATTLAGSGTAPVPIAQTAAFNTGAPQTQAGFGTPPPPPPPPVLPDEFAFEEFSPPPTPGPAPSPTPTPTSATDEFLFLRHGGVAGPNLEVVGEAGPELVDLPSGTRVTPLKKLSKDKVQKLRRLGIRGMQEGGIVDPLLPFGVRRALSGVTIEPTRRRLSRAAGLPVLSAQARQNLLPEELEVFNRLSQEAGIPEGAFAQEQRSAFPGANLARGRARFAPRVLR